MLEVTLDLHCNACGRQRFRIPTLEEPQSEVRCAGCLAFKCRADDLERQMAAASSAGWSPSWRAV